MAIPSVSETVRDGGLGVTTPVSMMAVVIGPASSGTANQFNLYSDVNSLKDAHGEGLGVEQAASILASGGRPVAFVRSNTSVAGSIDGITGSFTEDGSAGSVVHDPDTGDGPVITVDADNADRTAEVVITIGTGGALETATFTYTVGGVASGDGEITTNAAGVHTLVNGVVVTFPSGTYVAADAYTFTATHGGGALSVTGTANYDMHARVEILQDGGRGVATFRYSLDGYSGDVAAERTYSQTLIVPSGGTYAVPGAGISLVFAAEDFYAGDVYEFDCVAPGLNATDLGSAFVPIVATETPFRLVVVATGDGSGNATAHALLAVALQSQLNSLAADSVYRRGIVACGGGDATADAAAAYAAFSATEAARCMTVYGQCRRATTKPIAGLAFPRVMSADPVAARAAGSLASTDLKRVADGALAPVVKTFHDERKSPSGLDDISVATLRTWRGRPGVYITSSKLKSAPGSDFTVWPRGIVMDIACEVAHNMLQNTIGRSFRTVTKTVGGVAYPGVIDPRDAGKVNDQVTNALISQLATPLNAEGVPGHVQAIRFRINDTHNFLSTGVVVATVSIKPLGYVDFVDTQLGFVVELPEVA